MLESKSLKYKMTLAFSAVAACLLIAGGISVFFMKEMSEKYHHIAHVNFSNNIALSKMQEISLLLRAKTYRLGLVTTNEDVQSIERGIQDDINLYNAADKEYLNIPFAEGEEKIYNEMLGAWKNYLKEVDRIVQIRKMPSMDSTALRQRIATEFRDASQVYRKGLQQLMDFQSVEAKKWQESAERTRTIGVTASLAAVLLGFVLAIAIGTLFSRSLSKRLKELADKLSEGANTVSSASDEVSSAGAQLSTSATEQASALQETVASIEQVSAMVAKNADNAKHSQEVSNTSQEVANRGKEVIGQMIQSIDDISHSNGEIVRQIEASNREVSDIVKVISDIGDKTKVINEIVFQTKLLSFNASVEAARAGEHGKGFAVVAEEVGNLAQMSGSAAKEISTLLESSIQKVEATVRETKSRVETLVQSGKDKVQFGSMTAKKCGEVLEEIVRNVASVGQMVSEIANASSEQAQGVGEINKAMIQMDQVTQQNASASEQAASAAGDLTHQARFLRSMVQNLVAMVEGHHAGPHDDHALALANASTKKSADILKFKKLPVEQKTPKEVVKACPMKRAVGASDVPSEDDSRFQSV